MTSLSTTDTHSAVRHRDPVLGISAVASFVITFAVLLVPHDALPDDAGPREVTAFFEANYVVQQSQTVMHALGAVALLVFLTRLSGLVGRLERPGESWSRLATAAGAALVTVVVVTMGLVSAVIALTGTIDGAVQETLYMIGWDLHFKVAYLIPLVLVPVCAVLRRAHAAPTVLTWTGLLLGGVALLSTLGNLTRSTMFVQYPVFMLFLAWTLAAGLVLSLRGVRLPVTGHVDTRTAGNAVTE
jgi:hypothetical protein